VTPTAVVPIRSFDGLTRLADALPNERRSTLMLRLALRTTEALRACGTIVVVVSGDPAVRTWASNQQVRVVDEPDPPGLDAAAAAGMATTRGPWLVVHADLPLITPGDVRAAIEALDTHRYVLAPSHDGGTNLIGGAWPIFEFSYGPGSFRRHLAQVPAAAVLIRRGLSLDLDRARDLETLRNLRTP
jgi:2-phospho-L-lactate/phosphoenolpyruvate guanylyltransferase